MYLHREKLLHESQQLSTLVRSLRVLRIFPVSLEPLLNLPKQTGDAGKVVEEIEVVDVSGGEVDIEAETSYKTFSPALM